jgi:hypothetical protein
MEIILIDSDGNKWTCEVSTESKSQYIILADTLEYFELQDDGD